MEKVIRFLPSTLLLSYAVKTLIVGPTLQDSLIVGVLSALVAFYEYNMQSKRMRQLEQDIKELKENIGNQDKLIDEARTYVSSLKMNYNQIKKF